MRKGITAPIWAQVKQLAERGELTPKTLLPLWNEANKAVYAEGMADGGGGGDTTQAFRDGQIAILQLQVEQMKKTGLNYVTNMDITKVIR